MFRTILRSNAVPILLAGSLSAAGVGFPRTDSGCNPMEDPGRRAPGVPLPSHMESSVPSVRTAAVLPSLTPESEILERVTPRRPLKGGVVPADIAKRLGTTHVGGRYHFTDKPFLIEGAERARACGFQSVKFWFASVERGYSFSSDWRLPEGHTLEQLARHPYFQAVLAMPFDVIALEVMPVRTPTVSGRIISDLLDPGYDFSRDETQVYELARHLLRTYHGRNVTFLLQNWEGDWMFRGSVRDGWMKGEYPQLEKRVEAFTRWFDARQRGVERARAEATGSRCSVWHAVEVNRVFDLLKGIPTLTTHVLPLVRPDFISWSCYDGLNTSARSAARSAVGIWQGLELIQHYAHTTRQDAFGRAAVFIGEIGFPENITTPGAAAEMMDGALGTLLARQVPHIFYWELFCNERRDGTRPRPVRSETADELRGFWLVRPDGSLGGAGEYFSRLMAQAGGRLQ